MRTWVSADGIHSKHESSDQEDLIEESPSGVEVCVAASSGSSWVQQVGGQ